MVRLCPEGYLLVRCVCDLLPQRHVGMFKEKASSRTCSPLVASTFASLTGFVSFGMKLRHLGFSGFPASWLVAAQLPVL